jgi:hypothetical protein
MHSTVRELAGIGFADGKYPESFPLAYVRLSGEAPDDEVIPFYAVSGLNVLAVLAPLPDGIHRIVAPTFDAPEEPATGFVQSLLGARGLGPGRTDG